VSYSISAEEAVIREWVEAMTTASGAPLPPSQRRAQPLPRRRVLPVIVTLLDIIDELRESRGPLVIGTDDRPWLSPQLRAAAERGEVICGCGNWGEHVPNVDCDAPDHKDPRP
jgi:hypothetical protein